jgi:DNA invertase Pin-like site-specific DNA recombinase
MPTKTIAYLRVSTEKQADHGVSLDAQRSKIEAYAQLYDLRLVDLIVDAGQSAKTLDRPGLQRALAMLRAKQAEALLVTNLDRLTRSVVHLGQLVEDYFAEGGKWALLSVSEQIDTRSAAGRLVLNVLGSVAQWQREAIGERTKAAMRHKIAMGEYIGGEIPFGYRLSSDGVKLVRDLFEQDAKATARALRQSGMSLREIAAVLQARGVLTRSGRPFAPFQVSRMLRAA